MAQRSNTTKFADLFLNNVPLLDVRAPIEFTQGAFPTSTNVPLMTDIERQKIGTCYKKEGQQAAIALGHQLVSGATREERIENWCNFAKQHPEGYLYCFRGGLRSQTTQRWMAEAGVDYPLVEGGYKALRRFLIEVIEQEASSRQFMVLTGRTGTGKTKVIEQVQGSYDLEGFANHRGSSFGRMATVQPTQINFEHRLAIAMLKQQNYQGPAMLEDESVCIGSVHVPKDLFAKMKQVPLVVLEETLESRIGIVIQDYIIDLLADHQRVHGDTAGWQSYCEYMLGGVDRIRKRLGHQRHQLIRQQLDQALQQQHTNGSLDGHRAWIEALLTGYYDPMYDYQLSKKTQPIAFRGDRAAVVEWFNEYQSK